MPDITESIIVDRPREEVWKFLVEPENVRMTSSNLQEYEQVDDGDIGVGTRFRGVVKVAGRNIEWTNQVTRFDDGKSLHTKSLDSPIDFTYDTDLTDADGGTEITVHQDIGSFGGFFGKLADPLVVRMYRKDVRANLEKMKDALEAS